MLSQAKLIIPYLEYSIDHKLEKSRVYSYQAFGLGICSQIPLFNLPVKQEVKKDVEIKVGAVDVRQDKDLSVSPYEKLTPREAVFSIGGVGRFRVFAGNQVMVYPAAGSDQRQVQRYLVGPVMALLLYQRNHLVLHASAVSMNGHGIAFLGDSGAGKSSIAAAFLARGYKLVVDDIVSVDIDLGDAWAEAGFPYIKLSDEAKDTLALKPEQLVFMDLVDGKASYFLKHLASGERVRLLDICVIQFGEEVVLERYSSQQALFQLMRYSIPSSMVKVNHVAHFERCVELVKHTQIYGLVRPESLAELARLVDVVETNLGQ